MGAATERPFVFINMAMTVDGKITSAKREYPRFSSPHDRIRMDRLRASADALMVAAGTVRADNPTFHVRTKEVREETENPVLHRVVVSASGEIPVDSRFFDASHGGDSILVTTQALPDPKLASFEGRAEVWRFGRRNVDLRATLGALRERGVRRLLVEGGGELNWSLLRLDLADELYVTIAPALLGGSDAPTLLGGVGWPMKEQRRLRLLELEREGDELYGRYAIET
ncbi:MAG: 2,5-diamino-6-(ribosylamino)-4(3H)-pyrimidinone 5'-phosphate reductase [Acidobacteria bacterium]|nr:2,5-diamino-6-(ribosylamino)-4(3H)-pyrimidinone 5'-phosphate reductase [Acidobacteriota bacterium]NIM63479.1 2,5-diamino-6-(ribosylamino)-4(3H)-pyrimidinone 5'-phosphate reductase [Acidobacteriota bacterium]NIO60907.1 2,5-diamino-6-(ribosylamino)-4(3H)-pyrimidinone 5'-phosphate reductase [Acidobacteriota bacterium]NIQ31099.1 2,5-diamino-6-(ribosylamino)-4(3H)-pyrimidinone 5'-phosphate reductase [Acidobacteriota bacterium]NIQ87368.1 2,5-diamino-6-(ribosylamino)-4(3H)-pyrimidinone 5'-phosphate